MMRVLVSMKFMDLIDRVIEQKSIKNTSTSYWKRAMPIAVFVPKNVSIR